MKSIKKGSELLRNFTDEQIADIVKSNDALDQEDARMIKEEEERKAWEDRRKSDRKDNKESEVNRTSRASVSTEK